MDFNIASDRAYEDIDWNAGFGPRPADIGRFGLVPEALHGAPPPEGAHCVAHPKIVVLRAIEAAGFSEDLPDLRGCDFTGQIAERFIKDFEPVLAGRAQRGVRTTDRLLRSFA